MTSTLNLDHVWLKIGGDITALYVQQFDPAEPRQAAPAPYPDNPVRITTESGPSSRPIAPDSHCIRITQ